MLICYHNAAKFIVLMRINRRQTSATVWTTWN